MSECEYSVTVTLSRDYSVKVIASDDDVASRLGEAYVKRHYSELKPDVERLEVREVNVQEG